MRSIPSHGGLVVPSASQAWQNGHRSHSEEPHRYSEGSYQRPSLASARLTSDRSNPTASNSTPRRHSASALRSQQSFSTVPTTFHSSISLAGPSAPGTTSPAPMQQHRRGYYTSIHTFKVTVSSRRTTSDGRTKIKLALLGVRVERCGVCLMQFREGDVGAKTVCEHV